MLKKLIMTLGSTFLILLTLISLKEGVIRRSAGGTRIDDESIKRAFDKGVAKPIGGMIEHVAPPRSERK